MAKTLYCHCKHCLCKCFLIGYNLHNRMFSKNIIPINVLKYNFTNTMYLKVKANHRLKIARLLSTKKNNELHSCSCQVVASSYVFSCNVLYDRVLKGNNMVYTGSVHRQLLHVVRTIYSFTNLCVLPRLSV